MQVGRSAQIRKYRSGLTLVELVVALGIFALLAATIIPSILGYRARSSVNESAALVKSLIEQATETAKTSGSPVADDLRVNGLTTDGATQATQGAQVVIRLRKRLSDGAPAQILAERILAKSSSVLTEFEGLGLLDIETENTQTGVFVEILERREGEPETVLVTLPIDVNGEFILASSSKAANIRFRHKNYAKNLHITMQGVATLNRR